MLYETNPELLFVRGRVRNQAGLGSPLCDGGLTPYAAMAREDQLAWPTLDEVTKAAKAFLDPVLAGDLDAAWSPERWTWDGSRAR